MNLPLTVSLFLSFGIALQAEDAAPKLPVITLPVRVHLVQSDTMPAMHTTLVESDIRRIFGKVNKVWAQAGIQFEIESIGPTVAIPLKPEMRLKPEADRIHSMIPKERLSPTALDVCYVKEVRPNGFYYGEPVVVKDTASLKEVPGGLDEPLPRVTSHEIGHALGLKHRQDTTNLMASGTTGFSLNETEIAIARSKAKRRLGPPQPPIDLGDRNADTPGAPHYTNASLLMPDGALESFFRVGLKEGITFFRTRSTDDGMTWSDKEKVVMPPKDDWGGPMPLLDHDDELHFIFSKLRGEGRKPAVDRFIDLFHMRSSNGRTQWTNPKLIFEGYVGSFQGFIQMKTGRIVAPFGAWQAGVPVAPPFGSNVTTCVYSDDGGKTWQLSPSKLIAPCPENTNGNCYGAIEPTLIELRDGRVWMLIRTETGFLYESYSTDGANWSPAQPSRFHSSHSPAFLLRLRDGRLVNFWNNCEAAPKVGKDGVYTGRDALHAAISDDDGKTWSGFREVYRDATRNGSPPKSGDRGTAYPSATETSDGRILLVSGQGAERRRRFLIDPEWLTERSQTETFANLDTWHLFKGIGKPVRYWRDRVQGPQLIPHPDKSEAKALHLRRPDDNDADGATWNFPAAKTGELTLRLRIEKDFGGAQISLTNRLFEPCDDNGEKLASYAIVLPSDDLKMKPNEWHTLKLAWNDKDECAVTLDGAARTTIKSREPSPDGLCYLRLRSLAKQVDPAGFMIESVRIIAQ